MRQHSVRLGAELANGVFERVELADTGFNAYTGSKAIEARTILLAQGVTNHRPRIEQEAHDRGVAQGLIRYCPICDAYEIRGRRVAVLGCSDHGAAEAIFVRHYTDNVPHPAQVDTDLTDRTIVV